MRRLTWIAMDTGTAERLRAGGPDANGMPAERRVSDGDGVPCRHCETEVAAGEPYLVAAHRPFSTVQPYAEVGPVFLHADACPRHRPDAGMPEMFRSWERVLIRGYDADERIVYGTGRIVEADRIEAEAAELLALPRVAFVHLRSARNNCWHARIERTD